LTEFLEMLKDPYRDRLGRVWIVDASAAIEILCLLAPSLLGGVFPACPRDS
jgi:hypothetical protein